MSRHGCVGEPIFAVLDHHMFSLMQLHNNKSQVVVVVVAAKANILVSNSFSAAANTISWVFFQHHDFGAVFREPSTAKHTNLLLLGHIAANAVTFATSCTFEKQ